MDDFYISFKHSQIDNNELEKYVDNMIKELSDLIGLSFNHCKINDYQLTIITDRLLGSTDSTGRTDSFPNLKILDLSDNYLTQISTNSLLKWIDLPSQPSIKITGNPVSLKNIKKIYNEITVINQYPADKINYYLSKIIFCSQGYYNKASKNPIYIKYVSDKILSDKWVDFHKKFYESIEYQNLIIFDHRVLDRQVWKQMEMCSKKHKLQKSDHVFPFNPNVDQKLDVDQLLDFNQCIKLLLPPTYVANAL